MKVIEYLKQHGVEKLKRDFHIDVYFYETLIVLNSSSYSPKNHAITSECQGLFLDREFNVVSRSFDKIPSYTRDENYSSILDDSYTFYERLEDCLIKIYYWNGKWNVGTYGNPFADSIIEDYIDGYINEITFEKVVLLALGDLTREEFQDFCKCNMDKKNTYLFGVTFEPVDENRIKVSNIWYLATRENSTGRYRPYSFDNKLAIRIPQTFTFKSFEECEQASQKFEYGFVVYKSGIPLFKIKSPDILVSRIKLKDIYDVIWKTNRMLRNVVLDMEYLTKNNP